MLSRKKKQAVIKKAATKENDTGSPEVQVALLTERITALSKHLKKNVRDRHSRRGLLQMVADRRKHLKYLEKKDAKRHKEVLKSNKL